MASTARTRRPSADETRARILAAAVEVFAERSFDGASTREIASRAEVTQPLLNYHFQSKEIVWQEAVATLFAELDRWNLARREARGGEAARSPGDDLALARAMVRDFVEFSARRPELHRIIMQESKTDGPRMDHLVDHHIRPLYESTVGLFRRLVDAGAVAPIPPEHFYYLLTGAGPTMFVLAPEARRLTGIEPTDDDVIAAHADAVCLLLFGPAA